MPRSNPPEGYVPWKYGFFRPETHVPGKQNPASKKNAARAAAARKKK